MADNEVVIKVTAKDDASRTLTGISAHAQRLGASMGGALKMGALGAAAGIGVLAAAGVGFVKAAAAEQVGIERLQTAIKTLDKAHQGSAAAVEKVIAQREKLSFSDDQLRDSLSVLIVQTGDYEEAVRRQAIAMDVARGTGMDFATASRLIGKINEETTNTFARYGIVIAKGTSETDALLQIQRRFAGQSETYANTAAGKWERFGNQMDNIKESIGAGLLPTVTKLADALNDFITKHQDDIDRFSETLAAKIPAGIEAIRNAFSSPIITHIFDNVRDGLAMMQPMFEWVIEHKVALAAAFTVIGAAMLLAFTPVTVPILAIGSALGGILYVAGVLKNQIDELGDHTARETERMARDWDELQTQLHDQYAERQTEDRTFWEQVKHNAGESLSFMGSAVRIAFMDFAQHIQMVKDHPAWGGIASAARETWGSVNENIRDFVALMRGAWADMKVIGAGISDDFWRIVHAVQALIDRIRSLIDWIGKIPTPGDFLPKLPSPDRILDGLLPGRASGGPASGWTMVGEQGRELVRLPGGSHVFNNGDTERMTGGNVAYVTINAVGAQNEESAATIARVVKDVLREELAMETLAGPRLPVGAFSPRRA